MLLMLLILFSDACSQVNTVVRLFCLKVSRKSKKSSVTISDETTCKLSMSSGHNPYQYRYHHKPFNRQLSIILSAVYDIIKSKI